MIVYKICSINKKGDILSYNTSGNERDNNRIREGILRYNLNQMTKPDFGKLFAFDSIKNAKAFGYSRDYDKLYKARANHVQSRKLPEKVLLSYGNSENGWNKKQYKDVPYGMELPIGTVFCSSITLLKEIT